MNAKTVLDSSKDAICAIDCDRRLVTFNASFAEIMRRMFNIEIREGITLNGILPEGIADFFLDIEDRTLAGESVTKERTFPTPLGGQLFVEFTSFPIVENGEIVGASIFGKDITLLRRTDRELQMLFEQSPLPMWVIDVETLKFLRVNQAACKLYGYSNAEFLDMTPRDLWRPQFAKEFREDRIPLIKGSFDTDAFIAHHRKKDGTAMEVQVQSNILNHDGRIIRLALIQDITERLQTEENLAKAHERFRLATEAVASVIYEVDLKTAHAIRSSGLKTLLGFEPDSSTQTADWWVERIHPDDRDLAVRTLNTCMQTMQNPESEYRIRHLEGHYITVWDRGIIIRDEDGTPIKLFGNTRDVTERVEAKREIMQANERFQLASEVINAAVYDWNIITDDCIYTEGLFPLLGFDPRDDNAMKQLRWFERIHSGDKQQSMAIVFSALGDKKEKSYEAEYRVRHLDGQYVYVWDRAVIVRDQDGDATRVIGSIQDITSRKHAEAQLVEERNHALTAKASAEEMSQLKTNFLANMSHEIRTPMTAILGFAEILAEDLAGTPQARYAKIMESNAKRLLETINSILDLARVESKKIKLNQTPIDLNMEIERLVVSLEPLASRKKLNLQFRPSKQPVDVLADAQCLRQIVTNLIGNALKFTDNGDVTVRVLVGAETTQSLPDISGFYKFSSAPHPTGEQFWIIVEDTGQGISRENIGLIFDEFKQESTGYGRNFEGTGLGLTISTKLAIAMGGSIEARSAQGVGSIFILRLPEAITREQLGEEPGRATEPQSKKPTILLVEDVQSTAEMTQLMVGNRATFLHVSNPAEARGILNSIVPDLILMDVNLGNGMNGLDLVREFRTEGLLAPIIAMTAYAMPKDRTAALDAGCSDYLPKPFTRDDLLTTIKRTLAKNACTTDVLTS